MSRSKRKTAIMGITCAVSEKQDKIIAHRRLRRTVHGRLRPYQLLKLGSDEQDTDPLLPDIRESSNVYTFAKDGKQRFDPIAQPEYMRK